MHEWSLLAKVAVVFLVLAIAAAIDPIWSDD